MTRYFHQFVLFLFLTFFIINTSYAQCPTGELEISLEIKTDGYGYETYWQLLPAANNCGTGTIASGGNTAVGCTGGGGKNQIPGGYGNNATYSAGPWCLTDGANYKIYHVDDWGDGGAEFTVKIGGYPVKTFKALATNESFTFKVEMPPARDAALLKLNLSAFLDAGSVVIKGDVENRGINAISSLDIGYSINNGPPVTSTITGLNILPFSHTTINHPTPWNATTGSFEVDIWVSNVNGLGNDENTGNDTVTAQINVKAPRVNKINDFINGYKLNEIASSTNQLITPRDLDFHPNGELWIVNQELESTGGSTVTIYNPGKSNQVTLYRKDGNAWHFMSLPSGIAFSYNTNFGTSPSVLNANHGGGIFTGPSLWSSDSLIYAQPSGGNGSHLDMLHESPYAMGIANEADNIFWVFDAFSNDIVRYDFKADHGPGNDDHSDGEILRYKGMAVNWINQGISSHLELDDAKKWLYIVDGGNQRVLRLDITTGLPYGTPSFNQTEPLAIYSDVINATWEVVVDSGLLKPVGVDVIDNRMIISDYENGEIYIYDVTSMPATKIGTIATGAKGIQGIVIGPEGNIWYVNSLTNKVGMIEPGVIGSIGGVDDGLVFEIYPNPTSGKIILENIPLNAEISITDISGKIVGKNISTEYPQPLNLEYLENGIYFIHIKSDTGSGTKKIVLVK